jgi:hypothetical protein
VTQIKFHIEGGAGKSQDAGMREGFRKFFAALDEAVRTRGNSIRLVLHGSRRKAYDQFCAALKNEPEAYHVLLVDSEDSVVHRGECWRHLHERQPGGWKKPKGAEEAQCQLMVQAIEAWFFADPDNLKEYYGSEFNAGSLPVHQNVEKIPKSEHLDKLQAASRQTKKGPYHKTRHLPDLLGRIDAAKVRERAWHCDRIFVTLSEKLGTKLTPLCAFPQEP